MLSLIIRHEYLTRVRKLSFWLVALLTPLAFVAIAALPTLIMSIGGSNRLVLICDESGLYADSLMLMNGQSECTYARATEPFAALTLHNTWPDDDVDAILHIDRDLTLGGQAVLYGQKQPDMNIKTTVGSQLSEVVRGQRLAAYDLPQVGQIIRDSRLQVDLATRRIDQQQSEGYESEIATLLSLLMSIIIYMFIFLYGNQVMTSVMEEKQTRVVETIVSCVRPTDLMAGKIIAIGLTGLTQIALWLLLGGSLIGVLNLSGSLIPSSGGLHALISLLTGSQFAGLTALFLLFFILGYIIYASLLGAVGSLFENQQESQQFMIPIMIPILFSMYAAMYASSNPDAALSVWCSIIPLTSPIVMLARAVYGVDTWQLVLCIALLCLTAWGSVWVAGRIYRNNILNYGKKGSWKRLLDSIRSR
ncbi:MAG: ABC transporter permease [Paludibacteraceae bacterium]|nr:ABC transporter permease [Paludibacteraceae bacterium]